MRCADWKMLSILSYILGVILFLSAFVTYLYSEQSYFGLTTYPYRQYYYSLVPSTVMMLAFGYVAGKRAKENGIISPSNESMDINFCPFCGTKRDINFQYCGKCGNKFP